MAAVIWSDRLVPAHAMGVELASVAFSLSQDTSGPTTANSFFLEIAVRVAGLEVGYTKVAPMQNGPVNVDLGTLGQTIQGRIDNWRAMDERGANCAWNAASAVGLPHPSEASTAS